MFKALKEMFGKSQNSPAENYICRFTEQQMDEVLYRLVNKAETQANIRINLSGL